MLLKKYNNLLFLIKRRITNDIREQILGGKLLKINGIDIRFLFSSSRGIHLYDNGVITHLVKGAVFGITFISKNELIAAKYVNEKKSTTDERSNIIKYHFDGKSLIERQKLTLIYNKKEQKPIGVHQIRYLNGFLWIINTRENVIWKCTTDGTILVEWTETKKLNYDTKNGVEFMVSLKQNDSYKHYNSIAFREGFYYILAHNCTHVDQSKRSYLIKLDELLNEVERTENIGRACHDIVFANGHLYTCNSREGLLMEDKQPILQLNTFIRGLGQFGSICIVGGNTFENKREVRDMTESKLFFVDYPGRKLLHTVTLGRIGRVLDISILPD